MGLLGLAAAARPESFESWTAKARLAQRAGAQEEALDDFSRALRLWRPENGRKAKASVLSDRAEIRERLGKIDGAVADLSAAIAIRKKVPSYYYRRGRLYLRNSQTERAIGDFYRAIAFDFNYKEAYYTRGAAYELQGNREFAQEDYRTACSLGLKEACAKRRKKISPAQRRRQIEDILRRCRISIERCIYDGASDSACVNRAPICEKNHVSGCCPRACVRRFNARLNQDSEAQAYRETFASTGNCAGGRP